MKGYDRWKTSYPSEWDNEPDYGVTCQTCGLEDSAFDEDELLSAGWRRSPHKWVLSPDNGQCPECAAASEGAETAVPPVATVSRGGLYARTALSFLLNAVAFTLLGIFIWLPFLFTEDEVRRNTAAFWRSICN